VRGLYEGKRKRESCEELTEGIGIQGYIDMRRNPTIHQDFLDCFIEFVLYNQIDGNLVKELL
jgi:hypothetical protein